MTRLLPAFDGCSIWIRGDENGVRIAIFGRNNVAHDMILLTPNEAIKVRNDLDNAIDRAGIDIDRASGQALADLTTETS